MMSWRKQRRRKTLTTSDCDCDRNSDCDFEEMEEAEEMEEDEEGNTAGYHGSLWSNHGSMPNQPAERNRLCAIDQPCTLCAVVVAAN